MKVDIIKENENTALGRKELKARVTGFEKTPNRKEVVKAIEAKTGADTNKIIIDSIKQEYGKKEAEVYAKVYKDMDTMKKYEDEYKIKRVQVKEEKQEKEEQTQEEQSKKEE